MENDSKTYANVMSPFDLGGVTLRNRIVFAPTTLGLDHDEYMAKISSIANGGAGMVIIGDVPVGKFPPQSLRTKKGFAYYQELTGIIHSAGAVACAQLHQSDSDIKGMLKYVPGVLTKKITPMELRPLLTGLTGDYITKMPVKKVRKIIDQFGSSAVLAKKAGFDVMQVHGDRMCGSFSSPLFNSRTDEFGGSLENRARFCVEAVRAVRAAVPDTPIDYKLPVRLEDPKYGSAGFTLGELAYVVPELERAGVTSFHVTLANHASLVDTCPPRNHPYFKEEGCFLPFCDEVRKYTDLPICGVGALEHPDFVDEQIGSGRIQLAAMSRQLIADSAWANKVAAGEADKIHYCVRCNRKCLGGMQAHEGVHCIFDAKKQDN